ncbi:hypothetical protein [Micromonospora fulviviridis]|uniref:hypothetical protein n=1 Tax=Micromonospora fulviviridis TaxID=47860 RepID=UPI00378D03AA
MDRARRFVAECGFAVAAVDVPGHGDRPTDEKYDRIATENQARVAAGEELAPLIADFQALVARQTVPGGTHGGMPASNWTARCGSSPGTSADSPGPVVRDAPIGIRSPIGAFGEPGTGSTGPMSSGSPRRLQVGTSPFGACGSLR